jgi:uncharacterized protein YggE
MVAFVINDDDFTGVVVVGAGTAAAPPDLVRIDLAAEAIADTVSEALNQATVGLARIRSVLADAGVPGADLRTTDTSVRVDHGPRDDGPQRFVARLGLSAVVRDVTTAGSMVQNTLEEAGDTARLSGLSFSHSDPSGLLATARDAAFADALAKAQQFAALAGRQLGAVVAVDDTAGGGPVPLPHRMAAMPMAAEFDIEGGQQEVSARVVVRWSWA